MMEAAPRRVVSPPRSGAPRGCGERDGDGEGDGDGADGADDGAHIFLSPQALSVPPGASLASEASATLVHVEAFRRATLDALRTLEALALAPAEMHRQHEVSAGAAAATHCPSRAGASTAAAPALSPRAAATAHVDLISADFVRKPTAFEIVQARIDREIAAASSSSSSSSLASREAEANTGVVAGASAPSPDAMAAAAEEAQRNAAQHLVSTRASVAACFPRRKGVQPVAFNSLAAPLTATSLGGVGGVVEPCVPEDAALLTVGFYHRTRHTKDQEFLVLADQPLSDLRDQMYCLTDVLHGDSDGGAFFFVEGTFYNDDRDGAPDCSRAVLDWVYEAERYADPRLGDFRAASMTRTRFADLSIRLGAPYLFVHQGDCRHAVVFTDLRLVALGDSLRRSDYPVLLFQRRVRRRRCCVCDIYVAKFATFGDPLTPTDPTFFCDRCYRPFHFDEAGTLLRDGFKVYPYFHDE